MESQETKQSEQGQVSSPATVPKDVNQNTYTEEETSLAEKFKVDPKVVRLNPEYFRKAELGEVEPEQAAEDVAETQDQPEQEQPAEPCIDEQTQERLKSYYKNLDPRTKLAVALLYQIQSLDGINFQIRQKKGKLIDTIWASIEDDLIENFHKPEIDSEDVWLAGVWEAIRMVSMNI